MEEKAVIVPEEIHLLRIDIVRNKLDVSAFENAKSPQLGLGYKMSHNLEEEKVKLDLLFSFKDKMGREVFAIQVDFHFHIEKMAKFYTLNEAHAPFFFPLLVTTLLGLCLSTARGIIFEKLKSNGIDNIIIPILSPQKLQAAAK